MISKTLLFEKNGYKVYKLTIHGCSYFIIEGFEIRYIRKTINSVQSIVGKT